MRTWLVIALIISLVANAFLIGMMLGRPLFRPPLAHPPFPALPPMLSGDAVHRIRDSFYQRNISEHEHLRSLRHDLVTELASDSTNRARVDSLANEIYRLQRDLQRSIIDYVDSLKTLVPGADRLVLQRWILESFGERDQMRREHRWRHGQDRPTEDRPRFDSN